MTRERWCNIKRWLAAGIVLAAACSALPVAAATYLLPTTADTHIDKALPDGCFSSATNLLLAGPDSRPDAKEVFLEFTIPDHGYSDPSLVFECPDCAGDNGLEISLVPAAVEVNTLTWNTRPPLGTVLTTTLMGGGIEQWISLPMAQLPIGQTFALRLRFLDYEDCELFSLEAGPSGYVVPHLELTLQPPANLCPFDPTDLDTSLVATKFRDKARLFPWKLDYDTGYHPDGWPLQLKGFFYASAGEKDIQTVGDLEATWISAMAFPGNIVDVGVKFLGDDSESNWTTAFGIKGGVRYKIHAEVGDFWYRKTDYVPKLPRIRRAGFGCTHEEYLPPAFDTQVEICSHAIWAGDLDCFLKVPASAPVNCAITNFFNFRLDWELLWGNPDAPDTSGSPPGTVCTPAFWPYPTTEMYFCLRPGLCVSFDYDGVSLTEEPSGQSTTSDNDPLTVQVEVPCDFAQARDEADGPQYFDFTLGPFAMAADWVLTLWTKGEPVIKSHFVRMLELTFRLGKAVCARMAPNSLLDTRVPLSFNKPEATFRMKIVEPEVCLITPADGDCVSATKETTVTWGTTWGAPDACDCRAKLDYRTRVLGSEIWNPWVPMHAEDDVENVGYHNFHFTNACHEAQVRVEFRDPNSQYLHELVGGTFYIMPVQACIEPYKHDFGPVALTEFADQDILITNQLGNSLNVEIASPDPEFVIESGGGWHQIPAGGSHTFTVRFQPETEGDKSCLVATGLCPVLVSGTGFSDLTGVDNPELLADFLSGAYPNPFNPSVTIHFGIARAGRVSLRLHDVSGRLVRTLLDEWREPQPGGWTIQWDGRDEGGRQVSSGAYFCHLQAPGFAQTRKIILLK
jgi:hypothetical protein